MSCEGVIKNRVYIYIYVHVRLSLVSVSHVSIAEIHLRKIEDLSLCVL